LATAFSDPLPQPAPLQNAGENLANEAAPPQRPLVIDADINPDELQIVQQVCFESIFLIL
jgi:hypothetical protein